MSLSLDPDLQPEILEFRAPADVECTLRFSIGLKFAIVTINFRKGEDCGESLRHFFIEEDIPPYLELPILNAVRNLLEEERNQVLHVVYKNILSKEVCERNALLWAHKFIRHNIQWTSDSTNQDTTLCETAFAAKYHRLISHKSTCQTLLHLEKSYAIAIQKLMESCHVAKENLHARQAKEMEAAMAKTAAMADETRQQQVLSRLVSKHVQETDELEETWKRELYLLKARQRKEYRDFVASHPEPEDAVEAALSEPKPATPSDAPSPHKKHASVMRKRTNSSGNSTRNPPEQASFTIPQRAESNNKSVREDATPPLIETLTVFLGSQQRALYNIQLLAGDLLDWYLYQEQQSQQVPSNGNAQLAPSSSVGSAARLKLARSLYSDALTAIVLLVDANLSYESNQAKKFLEQCDASTEFHFESVHDQLDAIRQSLRTESQPLKEGDFFATRHSNLMNAHVVFHLVVDKVRTKEVTSDGFPTDPKTNASSQSRQPLMLGLSNVLTIAAQYDISTLVVPLLLTNSVSEAMLCEPVFMKRADAVLKCVKAFLATHSAPNSSLRDIKLVLPGSSQPAFKRYKGMLHAVFGTVQ